MKLVFLNIIRYRNDECLQVHVFVIVTPESPHLVLYLILIGYYMYLILVLTTSVTIPSPIHCCSPVEVSQGAELAVPHPSSSSTFSDL